MARGEFVVVISLSERQKPDGRDIPIPVVIERRQRRTVCVLPAVNRRAMLSASRGLQIADNFAASSPA